MIKEFIEAMQRFVPEDARIGISQFRGDPNDPTPGKWNVKVINPALIDEGANLYVGVSAFKFNKGQRFDRKSINFAGGVLLMIDDLGDGPGAKFPLSLISALKPTALIETSPQNFQAIYMFDRLLTDKAQFESLINAFVDAQFLGKDTGMKGVSRVFRLPGGINGKAKYRRDGQPFKVRMASWEPAARYSFDRICEAFDLHPMKVATIKREEPIAVYKERIRLFDAAFDVAKSRGMIKNLERIDHKWIHVYCPWRDEHSDSNDTGTGLTLPSDDNGFYGGFHCWHGSCQGKRGWAEFADYVGEFCAEELEDTNKTFLTKEPLWMMN